MIFQKILFLIIFFSFYPFESMSYELGGLKISESTKNILEYDNNESRIRTWDEDVKIYLNNSFKKTVEKKKLWSDFEVIKPDYFFDSYYLYEKNNFIVGLWSQRNLSNDVLQLNYNENECEALKEQLILEKTQSKSYNDNRINQYTRSSEDNKFIFKDRAIYEFEYKNKLYKHFFTCNYKIIYADDKKHYVTATLYEVIYQNDMYNKIDTFYKVNYSDKFDARFIKQFKIWGNLNENLYNEDKKSYSLAEYRQKSLLKHKELIAAEIEEKEKQKKLFQLQLKIEEKLIVFNDKSRSIIAPLKDKKKEINDLENELFNLQKQKKELDQKFIDQNKRSKDLLEDILLQCFEGFERYQLLTEIVAVKINLNLNNSLIENNYNVEISLKSDYSTDKDKLFFDYLLNFKPNDCQISTNINSKIDLLSLDVIEFSFYNNWPFIRGIRDFSKNENLISLERKLDKNINDKLEDLQLKKKILLENLEISKTDLSYLEKKYLVDLELIKKQLLNIDSNYQLDDNQFDQIKDDIDFDIYKIEELIKNSEYYSNNETENNNDNLKNIDNTGLTLSEEDALKAQIYGCWSIPLGLPYNENLLVRIKLELNRDGTVGKSEILDHARMNRPGQEFYKVLASSALRAIKSCQPLRVPTTGYERWKELQLNFDAREMLEG